MGSDLTRSKDFIKFMPASRKGSNRTSLRWGSWCYKPTTLAGEEESELKCSGAAEYPMPAEYRAQWIPAPRGYSRLQSWCWLVVQSTEVFSTGHSSIIFLLVTLNVMRFSRGSQGASSARCSARSLWAGCRSVALCCIYFRRCSFFFPVTGTMTAMRHIMCWIRIMV